LSWLKTSGVALSKCGIGYFNSGGRGAIALDDIMEGEVLVSVPDEIVILPGASEESAKILEKNDLSFFEGHHSVEESMALIFTLVVEYFKGQKSNWAQYIQNMLGDNNMNVPDIPLFWDAKVKRKVFGTSFSEKPGCGLMTDAYRGNLEYSAADTICSNVVELCEEYPHIIKVGEDDDLCEIVCLMCALVSAYSFELGDDKYQTMVPFWDMLNHITNCVNVRLNHNENKKCLEMISIKPIKKHTQIINEYGKLGTTELIRIYGFLEEYNILDNDNNIEIKNPSKLSSSSSKTMKRNMQYRLKNEQKMQASDTSRRYPKRQKK